MYALTTSQQVTTEVSLETLFSSSPYTVLYFYPKDDTPWCTTEALDFTKLVESFSALWVQIIWVSRDDVWAHCSFQKKHWLDIALLTDNELVLHKKYGAWWEKNNYGKIVTGVVRSTFLIDKKWTILQERKNVKATGHAARILALLQEKLSS